MNIYIYKYTHLKPGQTTSIERYVDCNGNPLYRRARIEGQGNGGVIVCEPEADYKSKVAFIETYARPCVKQSATEAHKTAFNELLLRLGEQRAMYIYAGMPCDHDSSQHMHCLAEKEPSKSEHLRKHFFFSAESFISRMRHHT